MTRPEFISAARRPSRPILVERKRRRWTRGDVHAMGTAAVEAALCRAGGAMSGADVARILGRPERSNCEIAQNRKLTRMLVSDGSSAAVQKRDTGCAPPAATGPEMRADLSTAGLLMADIRRLIRPATGSFGRELWGVVP